MFFPLARFPFVACTLACLAPAGLSQQLIFEKSGSGSDAYGWAMASIGDLNGDSVRDLLVGAPQVVSITASGPGYVQLLSGADGSLIYELTGAQFGDAFGHSVVALGDVDGDGLDDFAVGARQATQGATGGGYVRIYSGASGSILHEVIEPEFGARAGQDLQALGDLSGDGVPDLLYSIPNKTVNGISDRGRVILLSGSTGVPFAMHTAGQGHRIGLNLHTGHFDSDGVLDYAAEAAPPAAPPYLRIWSGATFQELRSISNTGGEQSIPDQDGDGVDDFLVFMFVLSGQDGSFVTDFRPSLDAYPFVGNEASGGLGDYDGDGQLEVIGGGKNNSAVVRMADEQVLFHLGHPGSAMTSLGDLDGDGADEFALAYQDSFPANAQAGALRVFRGGLPAPTFHYCEGISILSFDGTASLSTNQLVMDAVFVFPNQFGVLFFGDGTQDIPFGNGRLCVGGSILRVGAPIMTLLNSTPIPLDFTGPPFQAGIGLLSPGDVRYFQFWYRIPGGGFDLTRALAVTFSN